jgi:RimJ/RimL family protein N-acetyltransferase
MELLNTDGWIKYIGDRNVKTVGDASKYLENGPLKSYHENIFGLRLVQLKSDHKPIGMCGLIKRDYLAHADIGFAFLPNYMGHGYAYEISAAVIHYAFTELQKEKILAITLPGNVSSIKLLEKIGFTYRNNFRTTDSNEDLALYSISKENYDG